MTVLNAMRYIGKPWVANTYGPESFDCWGLLVDIYKNELGIRLPTYANVPRDDIEEMSKAFGKGASDEWTKLDKPVDFCGVGLSHLPNRIFHVGIFLMIDGGCIMHTQQNTGCVVQSLSAIRKRWQYVTFYALHNSH